MKNNFTIQSADQNELRTARDKFYIKYQHLYYISFSSTGIYTYYKYLSQDTRLKERIENYGQH